MNTVKIREAEHNPADERLQQIREALRISENLRLHVCDLLAQAYKAEDWLRFGLDSFTAYADQCGLTQSQASKMLKIGLAFPPGVRSEFPPEDIDGLSIERLYVAAQLQERGVEDDPIEALRAAIVHPAEQLLALRDGNEPADRKAVVCPDCGRQVWHTCHTDTSPM